MSKTFDMIIRGGMIVDGTRKGKYQADIGIVEGVIADIGDLAGATATDEIDAAGKIVAPGFIDLHTHYDAPIHWDPYCSNSGENGVTTVVLGNCGFGFAPCHAEHQDRYMKMMEYTEEVPFRQMKAALPWNWETFPQWLDHLKALPKGVNILSFLPVNPLMIYVMGLEAAKSRGATPEELAQMKTLVHEAMDEGACGLGMSYLGEMNSHVDYDGTPMPTDTMQIADAEALASVLAERNEGVIQSLSKLGPVGTFEFPEKVARVSRRPIIHNVVATADMMPEMHLESLEWLDDMERQGLPIYGQAFLQRGWSEFKVTEFNGNDNQSDWIEMNLIKDIDEKLAHIAKPETRQSFRDNYDPMALLQGSGPLEIITVTYVGDEPTAQKYLGRVLGELAAEEGKHVTDVFLDVVAASRCEADFKTPPPVATNPDIATEVMLHPKVLAGTSDGGAHTKFFSGGHWPTELLIWLVREEGKVTLEETHYRLSGQPAAVLGLKDRGTLQIGNAADIVVYGFEELKQADFAYETRYDQPDGDWRRYMPTEGFSHILVNGTVTHENGKPNGAVPGAFLRITENKRLSAAAE
ncbi:MAG: N-acyl-D-amino-acid deacylase family protein [Alphaproteobacteria bacterium]